MRKINKALAAGIGCALFGLVSEAVSTACASCPLNSQCFVDDGSSLELQDKSLNNIGRHENKAALVVTNSSTVTGKNLKLNTALEPDILTYGVHANTGGTVTLEASQIRGWAGIAAEGQGTSITVKGGTIDTTAATVQIRGGASVTLDHVDMTTSKQGPVIWKDDHVHGGTLKIIGGSVNFIAPRINGNVPPAAINAGRGLTSIDGTKITSTTAGIQVFGAGKDGTSQLEMKNFSIVTDGYSSHGIDVNQRGLAKLEGGTISTTGQSAHGIISMNVGQEDQPDMDVPLRAKSVTITTNGTEAHGVYAYSATSKLEDMNITLDGSSSMGLLSFGGNSTIRPTIIDMQGGTITLNGSGTRGALATVNAAISLDKVAIHGTAQNNVGMHLHYDSTGSFTNGTIDLKGASGQAFNVSSGSQAVIHNSQIHVEGENSLGIVMTGITAANNVTFENSTLQVDNSYAVVANGGTDRLDLKDSTVAGRELVFAGNYSGQHGSKLEINARNSQLSGFATLKQESQLSMNLADNSLWKLRPSADVKTQSELSYLTIENSKIVFDEPVNGAYQTLLVGSGAVDAANKLVYQAGQGASITLNTHLNAGGALDNQSTDRLLIHGDVAGQTFVTIKPTADSLGGITSLDKTFSNHQGISIIQVSGQAQENSFVLPGGYVALNGKPYQYHLYAYGPGSSHGLADEGQKLVDEGNSPHWDWRLQSVVHIDNITPPSVETQPLVPGAEQGGHIIRAVVPQVPSYLIAPNALFRAGQQDIANLHRRLGQGHFDERQDVFIRAYGGKYDYQSNLDFASYGYDFDMNLSAVQAGIGLVNVETAGGNLRFGLNGSYGDVRFEPRQVDGAQETKIDLWSISPTLTYAHENGGYVDVIVSYGGFKGGVSTDQRGRTATLAGKSLNGSIEAGMPLVQTSQGWVVEPQAQLIYQQLRFDDAQDIDGFAVELGNLEQWTVKAGGEIKKSLLDDAKPYDVLLYGAFHLAHTVSSSRQIWLGDNFDVARFGTHLEATIGLHANFSNNLALYGDVMWMGALGSAGNSGLGLNSGLKITF